MQASALKAAASKLPKSELLDLLRYLLSLVWSLIGDKIDDLLRLLADELDRIVEGASPVVKIAVGIATGLLRFAAGRIEAGVAGDPKAPL